jgi:hypothetical protein
LSSVLEWSLDHSDGRAGHELGAPGGAAYTVTVDARARIDHMRDSFPTPDGVVSLVPLRIRYAYERDDDDDIIGVVMETTLGAFAIWLPMASAVGLAGQLVDIAENADHLRLQYLERTKTDPSLERRATNPAGVV